MRIWVLVSLFIVAMLPAAAAELGSYKVLIPKYADPFSISLSSMPRISSLPVDMADDGIDWVKVKLPKPCVNGLGDETFILVRKGTEKNLLVFFEGGGACADYETCKPLLCTDLSSCRPLLGIGSVVALESKYWFLDLYYRGGIFDVKNKANPFRNWTIVFVPYNTGDIHMGNQVVKYYDGYKSKTIYHVGYVNAIVALRYAAQEDWDKIVIAGSSAGGYATLLHSYRAWEIFGKPITTINDAGPGLNPDSDSPFQVMEISKRWGTLQNLPPEFMEYLASGEDLTYAIQVLLGKCPDCRYAFFEDQRDAVIGVIFDSYSFSEFQQRLLKVTGDIRANYTNSFCRYMPLDIQHTILSGGLLYPLQPDRVYAESINGYKFVKWLNDVLAGRCVDIVE